jgi:hypothetical protein
VPSTASEGNHHSLERVIPHLPLPQSARSAIRAAAVSAAQLACSSVPFALPRATPLSDEAALERSSSICAAAETYLQDIIALYDEAGC